MRTRALHGFCNWLEQTPASLAIQNAEWVVPAVQTLHILSIAAVMSSVVMIDLRVLGILGRDQPLHRVTQRFLPVVWWTLPLLLATGIVMIVGEPARRLYLTPSVLSFSCAVVLPCSADLRYHFTASV